MWQQQRGIFSSPHFLPNKWHCTIATLSPSCCRQEEGGSLTGHCCHSPERKKKERGNRQVCCPCVHQEYAQWHVMLSVSCHLHRKRGGGMARSPPPSISCSKWGRHPRQPGPCQGKGEGGRGKRGRKQPASRAGGGGASWEKPVVGFRRSYTRLYSFKFSCRMVSLTAANTNRMFSVSVAHVKWE